jgi:hypothetical protein
MSRNETKSFNVHLNRDLWLFLKKESANRETSMSNLIALSIEKFKKYCENRDDKKEKLTSRNADV